jgi:hypothetical protein
MPSFLEQAKAAIKGNSHCPLLCLLIGFHAVNNWLILKANHLPLICDLNEYYQGSIAAASNLEPVFLPGTRPPFPMMIGSLAVRLLGATEHLVVFATGLFFLAVLVLSVFGIGRLMGGRRMGLWAAFLVSFYPAIFGHSRIPMADLPLTATVALFYWTVLRSEYFRRWPYTIAVGLSLAVCSLTKPLFWVFILPPIVAAGLDLFASRHREPIGRRLLVATFVLLCSAIPAALWYWRSFAILKDRFIGKDFPGSWSTVAIDFAEHLSKLVHVLYLGGLFLPLLLLSLPFFYFGSTPRKHKGLLIAWVVFPYVVLSLLPTKLPRFAMPSLPALALISTALLTGLWSWGRHAASAGVLLATLAHYLSLSYLARDLPSYERIGADGKRYLDQQYVFWGLFQAEPHDWGVNRAFTPFPYCAGDPPIVRFLQCPQILIDGLKARIAATDHPVSAALDIWDRCRIQKRVSFPMEREAVRRAHDSEIVVACDFPWEGSSCPDEQESYRDLIRHQDRYDLVGHFALVDGTGVSIAVRNQTCLRRFALPSLPSTETQSLFIDAGSPEDRSFIEGASISEPGASIPADAPLDGIPRAALSTYRVGSFRYYLTGYSPDALVELWFMESYWTQVGQRIFDVRINRQVVLRDFDVLAHTTRNVPIKRAFRVPTLGSARLALRGAVEISFEPKRDLAMVNALRVTFSRASSPHAP